MPCHPIRLRGFVVLRDSGLAWDAPAIVPNSFQREPT